MITSSQNPKIQWVRGLQGRGRERRAAQAFVIEGVRLAEEAQASGWEAQLVLYTEDLNERGQAVVDGFAGRGVPVEQVSDSVLRSISDTQAPQGILAVLSLPTPTLPDQLNFVFIPDGVRDPGNLGTMLRTAGAAGVQAIILPPGAVDPFAPKVVRSAMGAHFRLPICPLEWEQIAELVDKYTLQLYLAAVDGGIPYDRADFRLPTALVIGGEAEGAGDRARQLAHARVHIPMPGGSESLNAAIAASILLFEVVRQRRLTA